MRPPDLPGGNSSGHLGRRDESLSASMRPPDLPGGNWVITSVVPTEGLNLASMRPPDLPGGNPPIACAYPR